MSNTPNNPLNPLPPDKGPWLYSGAPQPTPAYTPPARPAPTPSPPPATPSPRPADDISRPAIPPRDGPAPQPAVAPKPAAEARPDEASLASIVDTIEAIIIALILALTFRAFIIEAFVIPTGSMAPTLLGAHVNVICPQCGYTYTRDASLDYQQVGGAVKDVGRHAELTSNSIVPCDGRDTASLICPNCQYLIPYEKLPQFLGNRALLDNRPGKGMNRDVPFAWANNGDRILVLKYVYSLLNPSRFDVIVFKEPMNAQDNFIKRLIGLPGETIEIIGGKIYVGPPGKAGEEDRIIARKPPHVQKDVWQLVYDNDYCPQDEGKRRVKELQLPPSFAQWHNPWVGTGQTRDNWNRKLVDPSSGAGAGLQTVGGPVVHYDAAGPGTLEFNAAHHDPYTYNVLGYNNDIHDLYRNNIVPLLPVGDLRLETTWTPRDAAGEWVALSVGSERNLFRVVWSRQGLELLHYNVATKRFESLEKLPASEQPGPKAGQAYNIALNNVDHSVQFFIDGKMVLEHRTPWSAAQAHLEEAEVKSETNARPGSLLDALAPHVEVSVGGACTLGHLKVFRDLYYTQTIPGRGRYPGAANEGLPLTLGPDEFFALGDNSRQSHDGRTWETVYPALDDLATRRGIVPRRYLLGKAIFVYWPAGFRFSDKVPFWPLVPNTGDMRLIR